MKNQQEIKFLATEAKSKLTAGKTCYQGQLQHNQTLSEKETKRWFAEYCGEHESLTTRYVDALGEFIAEEIAHGYRMDFGSFAVGLKFRGGLKSANAEFDPTVNSINVEMTPGTAILKAAKQLKPVNVTKDGHWHMSGTYQDSPYAATDEMALDGERVLYVGGIMPPVHPDATDEGVWIEDDLGNKLLVGEIIKTEFSYTRYRLTGPIAAGKYWSVLQGRYKTAPELIRVKRRITAR